MLLCFAELGEVLVMYGPIYTSEVQGSKFMRPVNNRMLPTSMRAVLLDRLSRQSIDLSHHFCRSVVDIRLAIVGVT
jgi:hypothetical protein